MSRFVGRLVAKKSLEDIRDEAMQTELKRSLGWLDLTMLGIGGIIGAGIFVLTGTAAAERAGPAIILSFLFAGVASALAALCYAELASMIPVSGSAYTYTYATLGEFMAWFIGWDLMLEYLVSAAAVAVSWAAYFKSFFKQVFDVDLADSWTVTPFEFSQSDTSVTKTDGYFNAVACAVLLVVMLILAWGIRESSTVNALIVITKIVIVLLVIGFCAKYVKTDNFSPFVPEQQRWGKYGWSGVLRGAVVVFFAYIGFDAVSTVAHESKNPQRDLPIGILLSLVVCTVLYIAVSTVMVGVVKYTQLNVSNPMAAVVEFTGQKWLTIVVDVGALCGLFSVMMVVFLGQTRIFYSMSKDGLFPAWGGRVNRRTMTPVASTVVIGIFGALLASVVPLDVLADLTSIGTLLAFALVSAGVIILRYTQPHAPRKFVVPGPSWGIPVLSILCCAGLASFSTLSTLYRLLIWMGIGLIFYFLYGWRHSILGKKIAAREPDLNLVELESRKDRPSLLHPPAEYA
ncbi:hypothetical protein CBR_g51009 [Chara braunii]|uniref:Cationic amino acid transporter C-terminal domain-containing protein n=1 Tax=Chara braunii TaxID=69332 RepID=A0A388M7X1_CHABU|nr:hypothetical protein CBR_g51009 [Chara braunii]|eukprot:GBG90661.1 hypothetical protein CBR_g51009 [Chara braunii]